MIKYGLILTTLGSLTLGFMLFQSQRTISNLKVENQSLSRSVETLAEARDQARQAQAVAHASLELERELRKRTTQAKEELQNGGEDVPLPDWFRTWHCNSGYGVCSQDPD